MLACDIIKTLLRQLISRSELQYLDGATVAFADPMVIHGEERFWRFMAPYPYINTSQEYAQDQIRSSFQSDLDFRTYYESEACKSKNIIVCKRCIARWAPIISHHQRHQAHFHQTSLPVLSNRMTDIHHA